MLSKLARQAGSGKRFFSGQVQVTRLANGVRFATQQTYDPHCTVGCWMESGIRDENKFAASKL